MNKTFKIQEEVSLYDAEFGEHLLPNLAISLVTCVWLFRRLGPCNTTEDKPDILLNTKFSFQ